jgi:hypothetical protein
MEIMLTILGLLLTAIQTSISIKTLFASHGFDTREKLPGSFELIPAGRPAKPGQGSDPSNPDAETAHHITRR